MRTAIAPMSIAVRASRVRTVGLQAASSLRGRPFACVMPAFKPAAIPIDHFRSLLIDRFDPVHGGFGSAAEASAPSRAAVRAVTGWQRGSASSATSPQLTLDRMRALWDPVVWRILPIRRRRRLEPAWNREDARRQRGAPARATSKPRCSCATSDAREQAAAIVRWVEERDGR